MARKRAEIKQAMTTPFMQSEAIANLYGFQTGANFEDEFSLVSIESIIFDTVAYGISLFEQLFDAHRAEINEAIANQKTGTARWYRTKSLAFQWGFNLLPESDLFDNNTATAAQIEASKIVKQVAVSEADDESRLIIKIAGETSGLLAPITDSQKASFDTYIQRVKFAGTAITVINFLPDRLFLDLTIFRNPLVIDENGNNILSGGKPVEEALLEFVKELPFNGELVVAKLVDKLQAVDGVEIPHVNLIQSSWINPATNDYGIPQPISVRKVPESGYFTIVDFNSVQYVV
ncbi:MAG: nucleotidyltransferase [Bacteroidetes bacterium]|nr:nucleotidyltransferase [Bacteroidota bacterium]